MCLNRETLCFVLAFCASALAPLASLLRRRCSMHWHRYFLRSSFSRDGCGLSPVSAVFIILEKPRGKKVPGVLPYQWMLQCGLCSQKNVEISQVFLTAAFHRISSTATWLSDDVQWVQWVQRDSSYFSVLADTGQDEVLVLQTLAMPLPDFAGSA